MFRAFSQAGTAERVRRGVGVRGISKLKQIYNRFLRYMFLSSGIPGSLLSVYRKSLALSHPVSSAPPRGVVSARQRGGFGAPAAGRPTAEPRNLGQNRSRPEMAPQPIEKIESAPGNGMVSEASKPQHLVHGRAADRALRPRAARMPKLKVTKLPSCRKGAQRLEIARCRTEIGACLLPSERRACIRLSPKRDVVVVMSRSASLRRSPCVGYRRSQRQKHGGEIFLPITP